MKFVADLHLHSKYSRACSQALNLENLALWAGKKGIQVLATGDWTHPVWFEELKNKLEQAENGLYRLKTNDKRLTQNKALDIQPSALSEKEVFFLLSTEISSIYSSGGKQRRIHNLVFIPNLETAEKITKQLTRQGANLKSDGRPIVGLSAKNLTELILEVEPKSLTIPAHCLLPGTRLHTNPKMKNIDEIKAGDRVFTHQGRFQKVTQVFTRGYHGKTYHIRPWYFSLGLTTTEEHPFYAIKSEKNCRYVGGLCKPNSTASGKHKCKVRHYQSYRPAWIPANQLEVGDVLLYPRLKEIKDKNYISFEHLKLKGENNQIIPQKILIDENFCRLAGYYLAEGYLLKGKNSIAFCFSENERAYIEDVKKLMNKVFHITSYSEYRRKNSQGIEITFFSSVIERLFADFFYDNSGTKRAETKKIPEWILFLPPDKQKEIILGWWRGDSGYTSSCELMNQMKTVFLRLGIVPSVIVDSTTKHSQRGNHKYGKRLIHANFDSYHFHQLAFFEDHFQLLKESCFSKFKRKLARRHGWVDDDYVYLPIRKIEEGFYQGEVFNLEVENDNSYVTEFATIHNCWTPWYSLYGSNSGFDSIQECFGDMEKYIYAVETGLSSSPEMNWRVEDLDNRAILSFSDAHSLEKLGREATVFDGKLSYEGIYQAIKNEPNKPQESKEPNVTKTSDPSGTSGSSDPSTKVAFTIEFYPEEGKYHYTGHRNCGVKHSPAETAKLGTTCPVCGKKLTVGVMHRVSQLAKRSVEDLKLTSTEFVKSLAWPHRPPYKMLVSLLEIISQSLKSGEASKQTVSHYNNLISNFGSELAVLVKIPIDELSSKTSEKIAEGIDKVRKGDIFVDPGFDGVYGRVEIWPKAEQAVSSESSQMTLF